MLLPGVGLEELVGQPLANLGRSRPNGTGGRAAVALAGQRENPSRPWLQCPTTLRSSPGLTGRGGCNNAFRVAHRHPVDRLQTFLVLHACRNRPGVAHPSFVLPAPWQGSRSRRQAGGCNLNQTWLKSILSGKPFSCGGGAALGRPIRGGWKFINRS